MTEKGKLDRASLRRCSHTEPQRPLLVAHGYHREGWTEAASVPGKAFTEFSFNTKQEPPPPWSEASLLPP